ncbi:hypothetical protein [Synechococcus sp. O70.2]|uniref:hypothetical protein n=1 Tax=Synechococcus sp. O70.2 TaxID=2964533 RepID=UPI0039C3D5C2
MAPSGLKKTRATPTKALLATACAPSWNGSWHGRWQPPPLSLAACCCLLVPKSCASVGGWRGSGTEPLLRLYSEAKDTGEVNTLLDWATSLIA